MKKEYVKIPYDYRKEARRSGALWDPVKKSWYYMVLEPHEQKDLARLGKTQKNLDIKSQEKKFERLKNGLEQCGDVAYVRNLATALDLKQKIQAHRRAALKAKIEKL